MIDTYSDYIDRYIRRRADGTRTPGEHHFVSAYLVPKLFRLNRRVPDYINPDGMKGLMGDIIYAMGGGRRFGIEVKFNTIRLTKREFNAWISYNDPSQWPDLYVGIGSNGVTLMSWTDFRTYYCACIRARDPEWIPAEIIKGYGPHTSTNRFGATQDISRHFPVAATPSEALERESHFENALVNALKPVG